MFVGETGCVLSSGDEQGASGVGADTEPLGLELLPCLLPDCQWSGRAIATLSVEGCFRDVVRHPKNGTVMALTGFTGRIGLELPALGPRVGVGPRQELPRPVIRPRADP